jgi:membrane associated rhomboid family serine protease
MTKYFVKIFAVRIGIIYLVSGFGGSVLSSLFIRNNISVGASGALFGLLGAMLSELITNWSIYTNKVSVFNHYLIRCSIYAFCMLNISII